MPEHDRPLGLTRNHVDAPIEIIIGTIFLYKLLGISSLLLTVRAILIVSYRIGVSCFFGLAATCLFLPLNHFAGKVVVKCQDDLMKARDERVALMNEVCISSKLESSVE